MEHHLCNVTVWPFPLKPPNIEFRPSAIYIVWSVAANFNSYCLSIISASQLVVRTSVLCSLCLCMCQSGVVSYPCSLLPHQSISSLIGPSCLSIPGVCFTHPILPTAACVLMIPFCHHNSFGVIEGKQILHCTSEKRRRQARTSTDIAQSIWPTDWSHDNVGRIPFQGHKPHCVKHPRLIDHNWNNNVSRVLEKLLIIPWQTSSFKLRIQP